MGVCGWLTSIGHSRADGLIKGIFPSILIIQATFNYIMGFLPLFRSFQLTIGRDNGIFPFTLLHQAASDQDKKPLLILQSHHPTFLPTQLPRPLTHPPQPTKQQQKGRSSPPRKLRPIRYFVPSAVWRFLSAAAVSCPPFSPLPPSLKTRIPPTMTSTPSS